MLWEGRAISTSHLIRSFAIAVLSCALGTTALGQDCAGGWENTPGNIGLASTVWSIGAARENTAIGPALYVGGQFSTAGGATAKSIARWDGASWSPVGTTGAVNGGTVYAIAIDETDGFVYVGGSFANMDNVTGTRNIAKWDGQTWATVGGGMSQSNTGMRSLVFFDGDLYAGGYLNEIGGVTAHKLAKWNGSTWSSLPGDPIGLTDHVQAMIVWNDGGDDALYIGGDFENVGGGTALDYIFKWNGSQLLSVGRGTNDDVEAMAVFNGELYIGGQFTEVYQADGTALAAEKVARWDGAMWHAVDTTMGTSLSTHVWSLATFDDGDGEALFAGGGFSSPYRNLAKFDGATWHEVTEGSGLNGYVYAMDVLDLGGGEVLYAGGTFTSNDGQVAQRITSLRPAHAVGTGDVNGDGLLDGRDIAAFVAEALNPTPSSALFCAADIVSDGALTLDDAEAMAIALLGS